MSIVYYRYHAVNSQICSFPLPPCPCTHIPTPPPAYSQSQEPPSTLARPQHRTLERHACDFAEPAPVTTHAVLYLYVFYEFQGLACIWLLHSSLPAFTVL